MNLWVVRAGSHGEQEEACLKNDIITIGWNDLPNLKKFETKQELKEEYLKNYTEKSAVGLGLKVGQIWRFATQIKKGDIIVLPSKFAPEIHVGIVKGEYQYKEINKDVYHIIPVSWEKTLSRSDFDEDLLYSFGSLLTVSCITRNNAAERLNALLLGQKNQNYQIKKNGQILMQMLR
jgi:restriction system protein